MKQTDIYTEALICLRLILQADHPEFKNWIDCLWATKKIFLLFLRMNSNPHHNYPVRKKPYFTRFFYCQSWTGGFRFPCFFFCVWEQGVLNSNQS